MSTKAGLFRSVAAKEDNFNWIKLTQRISDLYLRENDLRTSGNSVSTYEFVVSEHNEKVLQPKNQSASAAT